MKIVFFGAGSVGCYVGGRLIANGEDVILFGRERLKKVINTHGLTLTHYELDTEYVEANDIEYSTDPECLANADLIIITVKSQDTPAAITEIKQYAKPSTKIISLQNGVENPEQIKAGLPEHETLGAMVPFNVSNKGEGHFHCGTEGHLVFERSYETGLLAEKCNAAGMPTKLSDNLKGVLWGKLLLNLNNALNLLSNKPLKEELSDRNYRRVLARSIEEALFVLRSAGISPEQVGKSPPKVLTKILRLPNFAFEGIAKGMLKIDPLARSSMWEDMQAKRTSEIDFLNGAIVTLAKQHGINAPVNEYITNLVKEAFEKGESPAYSGEELLAKLDALKVKN